MQINAIISSKDIFIRKTVYWLHNGENKCSWCGFTTLKLQISLYQKNKDNHKVEVARYISNKILICLINKDSYRFMRKTRHINKKSSQWTNVVLIYFIYY